MNSAARHVARPLAVVTLLLATVFSPLLSTADGVVTAGLVAALLAVLVVSALGSARVAPTGVAARTRTRAVLDRMIPRTAQSDPDAGGHVRPRAPGILLPAS